MVSGKDDKGSRSGLALVSPELLSAAERALAERYLSQSETAGVLVGALRAFPPRDLRPVVLAHGVLVLVRFFDPDDKKAGERFQQYLTFLSSLGCNPNLAVGNGRPHIWVRRRYHPNLLSERNDEASGKGIDHFRKLISHVRSLHHRGLVHGHVAPSNVAIAEGDLAVLDHGFAMHGSSRDVAFAAPELRAGQAASAKTDIYGLATVARHLLAGGANFQHLDLLEQMLQPDPSKRPVLGEIEQTFGLGEPYLVSATGRRVATGRVITGKSAQESAEPVRAPAPSAPVHHDVKTGGAEQESGTNAAQKSSRPLRAMVLLGALAVALTVLAVRVGISWFRHDYGKDWNSEEPARREKVARAAIEGNKRAQDFLLEQSSRADSGIQHEMLRVGFAAPWRDLLTEQDRRALVTIALGKSVKLDLADMPSLQTVHPAIQLAILADLPINSVPASLRGVSAEPLRTLPAPFGAAFTRLAVVPALSGRFDLSNPQVQALAHLLTANVSEESVRAYLRDGAGNYDATAELLVLTPLFDMVKGLDEQVMKVLHAGDSILAQRALWFDLEKLAQWEKVPVRERLVLAAGLFPPRDLAFDQLIDLLQFPLPATRVGALQRLTPSVKPANLPVLTALSRAPGALSRSQIISLVAALQVEGETAYSFVAQWFAAGPEPQVVVGILAARPPVSGLDPFSVEAARYLKDKQWVVNDTQLARLVLNNEPLVRALVYTKLDPVRPEHRKLIEARVKTEANARLKEELQRRLSDAQGVSSAGP